MPGQCGLWIDHREALAVFLDGAAVTTRTVESGLDFSRPGGGSPGVTAKGRSRGRPGSRVSGPQDAVAEDRMQHKRDRALAEYYARVADVVAGADLLYVAGPGEAKKELAKVLGGSVAQNVPVVRIDAADRMTEAQWIARVREVFGEPLPRSRPEHPGVPVG